MWNKNWFVQTTFQQNWGVFERGGGKNWGDCSENQAKRRGVCPMLSEVWDHLQSQAALSGL